MPKTPRPWFWKARKAWYVQVDGRQIKLHENKKEADRAFYRLMAADGRLDLAQGQAVMVADACEAMIAQAGHCRANTRRNYVQYLGPFAARFATRRVDSLSPAEVIAWVAGYRAGRPLGESSRSLLFRFARGLTRWARDTGLVTVDPLARVRNPWTIRARSRPMSKEEYGAIMGSEWNAPFKEVVEFVWRTGSRPGELAVLAARHLDAAYPIARLAPAEHKTGSRTGRDREVYLPPDLWERLRGYAVAHPVGPLLRNRYGQPWNQRLISDQFRRLKARLGLACVLYQARHAFLTNLVEGGVPLARAARIAGHANAAVLARTYYHPETRQMLDDVAGATVSSGGGA